MPKSSEPLVAASSHTQPVTHLSFSAIQNRDDVPYLLVSSSKDGNPMLREWNGDRLGTFLGHKGAVWSAKISHDTYITVSGSADFTAQIWDTISGDSLHSFPHKDIVYSVAVSVETPTPYLFTGGKEKKVNMFHLGRPDAEPALLCDSGILSHDGSVKSVVYIEDRTVVSAGEDGKIKWWDIRTQKLTSTLTFADPITSMEWSAQAQRLCVTSGKTVAFIPGSPNGSPHTPVVLPYKPSSASIHPILKDRFVTGNSGDEWIRVHGMDGKELEARKGHHGPVHCVEYSPDGKLFASGSEDGAICLWQAKPGELDHVWQGKQKK